MERLKRTVFFEHKGISFLFEKVNIDPFIFIACTELGDETEVEFVFNDGELKQTNFNILSGSKIPAYKIDRAVRAIGGIHKIITAWNALFILKIENIKVAQF